MWAHPDDEAFLAAGTLFEATRRGVPVVCAYATRGEAGGRDATTVPEVLGRRRDRELSAALRILGVADHRCLGVPDGGLVALPFDVGVAHVAELIDEVDPAVVVTFGPDGFTGHPDHITVHRWVTAAVRRRREPPVLWCTAVSRQWVQRFTAPLAAFDAFWAGYPVAAATDRLLTFPLEPEELSAKVAALRAHRSQTAHLFTALGEGFVRAMAATEWFVAGHRRAAASRAVRGPHGLGEPALLGAPVLLGQVPVPATPARYT